MTRKMLLLRRILRQPVAEPAMILQDTAWVANRAVLQCPQDRPKLIAWFIVNNVCFKLVTNYIWSQDIRVVFRMGGSRRRETKTSEINPVKASYWKLDPRYNSLCSFNSWRFAVIWRRESGQMSCLKCELAIPTLIRNWLAILVLYKSYGSIFLWCVVFMCMFECNGVFDWINLWAHILLVAERLRNAIWTALSWHSFIWELVNSIITYTKPYEATQWRSEPTGENIPGCLII